VSSSFTEHFLPIKKIFNLLQIFCSYLLSRILTKAVHWGSPAAISFEPTNVCNLRCPECPTGQGVLQRDKGYADKRLFFSLIDSLSERLNYLTFYFQGEPYLHPDFLEMVRFAGKKKIFISTSTNGHFLTSQNAWETVVSGLDRLIISLDGTDAVTYSAYRTGGSFELAVEGIREMVHQKKKAGSAKPRIILQFLVLKTNQHQISEVRDLGWKLGVDKVEIKTAHLNDFENGNPLMPDNPKYSRYVAGKSADGNVKYHTRNPMPNHCLRMWSSCVITWDGWVVPCCFDKDAKYKMGNIHEETFHEIWNNEKYRSFRQRVLDDRKNIDICRNCTGV
jgi:radical SAM protein with 4Fe4S-binding SPASM domain